MFELVALACVVLVILVTLHGRQDTMPPSQRRRIWRNIGVLALAIVGIFILLRSMGTSGFDRWPLLLRVLALPGVVFLILFAGLRLSRIREDVLHDRPYDGSDWVIYTGALVLIAVVWPYRLATTP